MDWIKAHEDSIIKSYYEDKDKFYEFISKLDEPFQFISIMYAVDDWRKSLVNRRKYTCSSVPMLFDATCNGIQHLSALTREIDLAVKVNLITDFSKNKDEIIYEKPQAPCGLLQIRCKFITWWI